MVAYFKLANNIFMIAGAIFGFVLSKLTFIFMDKQSDKYINVVGTAAFVIVSVIVFRLISSIYAAYKYKKITSILYTYNKPKEFISIWEKIIAKIPKNIAEYANGVHHLAYAYESMGNYDKAIEMLSTINLDEIKLHKLISQSIVINHKARLYLLNEDIEKAKLEYDSLTDLKEMASLRAPSVSKNIGYCLKTYDIWLKILKNENISKEEKDYIYEERELAKNNLYREQISKLIKKIEG